MSTKTANGPIGNRTRDLPICSSVPQPLRRGIFKSSPDHRLTEAFFLVFLSHYSQTRGRVNPNPLLSRIILHFLTTQSKSLPVSLNNLQNETYCLRQSRSWCPLVPASTRRAVTCSTQHDLNLKSEVRPQVHFVDKNNLCSTDCTCSRAPDYRSRSG